jgi:hypothetical protein
MEIISEDELSKANIVNGSKYEASKKGTIDYINS